MGAQAPRARRPKAEAAKAARRNICGEGPFLLEALTYRSPPLSSMRPFSQHLLAKSRPSMLNRLFRPRPAQVAGRALYQRVVEQSRVPALYADLGAPDTVEGRFEVYSLHLLLLLDRFQAEGQAAAETSQA